MHFTRWECMLSYWLKQRNMTQTELARRTGWSPETPENGWKPRVISYWCSTELLMSVEAMYTVATILEIRMEDLYRWRLQANDNRRSRD